MIGWEPGSRIGDYVLGKELGAGGMGTVYMARHATTGADYALKALAIVASTDLALRFQREAEAQAAVDGHPNVVRLHSVGQAQGRMYLVMDLAQGGDLQARIDQGPLPWQETVLLIRELAAGLEHVHARGVLHRDLKPANVLFGEGDRPKLVDFGLARVAGSDALTQTGELLGTPTCMAPEQARGERDAFDERTDVYGLGAILYCCLTGRPPFHAQAPFAVLAQVLEDPPRPPRDLVPDVPVWLEQVCLKALAKKPADRYPSPRALADALAEGHGVRGSKAPLAIASVIALAAVAVLASLAVESPGDAPLPTPVTSPTPKKTVAEVPTPTPEPTAVIEEFDPRDVARLGFLPADPAVDLPAVSPEDTVFQILLDGVRKGNARPTVFLAQAIKDGKGLAKDPVLAKRWFYRAALNDEAGVGRAWAELGRTFLQEGKPELGLQCMLRAMKNPQGAGAYAHLRYAEMFQYGQMGTPKDPRVAEKHFLLGAAAEGDPTDQASCAEGAAEFKLLLGEASETTWERAEQLARVAAGARGSGLVALPPRTALYQLSRFQVRRGDYEGAVRSLRGVRERMKPAHFQGSLELRLATFDLAVMYLKGQGVDAPRIDEACALLEEAAELHKPARDLLAAIEKADRQPEQIEQILAEMQSKSP